MTLDIKIDGESVLLHDNAATIIYALRTLETPFDFWRVREALRMATEEKFPPPDEPDWDAIGNELGMDEATPPAGEAQTDAF